MCSQLQHGVDLMEGSLDCTVVMDVAVKKKNLHQNISSLFENEIPILRWPITYHRHSTCWNSLVIPHWVWRWIFMKRIVTKQNKPSKLDLHLSLCINKFGLSVPSSVACLACLFVMYFLQECRWYHACYWFPSVGRPTLCMVAGSLYTN
jgi:hypothetical protein